MQFTEAHFENAIIELFQEHLGYKYQYGPEVERDYTDPLYDMEFQSAIRRINPTAHREAISQAIMRVRDLEEIGIVQKNMQFIDYLQNGIEVTYYDGKQQSYELVKLVDYENIENNSFLVVNQWTFKENSTKRPDIVVFINGLPLVVVELKSPSRESTDVSEAYRQLTNYKAEIPSLFAYNAFCVMSDQATSKAGTITSNEGRYMEWKTVDGSYKDSRSASFDTLFLGMFEKRRLLDIIKNFICYSREGAGSDFKILAAYHQYYAVKKAVESALAASRTDGKGGVFWHTQGSGKSLSMVFFAKLLQDALDSPTIVVLTDRNDLDHQLYSQFSYCQEFLRQTPQQAESRINLRELLKDRKANGIFFSTMQKFEESSEPLSKRRNIVVMTDEAHRGQYGLEEKVDPTTGRISIGTARIIRDSLPKATYVGFTGTPISSKDRNTREVFGDYIDICDMTQSVEDGATRPVFYESRVINLKLNSDVLELIDKEYDAMALLAEPYAIHKSKKELGRMDSVLGAPETIDSLCKDIIKHYEDGRETLLTGKAMIVAYSRPIALKIYRRILELRPQWGERVKVVMSSGNDDPEDWREIIGNDSHRDKLAIKFKDNNDPMKIAIVVDMWLTGFDVPSLATMYVYKPMVGHNLMQAIARVNRVYEDKEGGLIVDYVGIARALKQAMNEYTVRDRENYGDLDIAKTAKPKFIEKLEVCRDLLHGFDYSKFMTGSDYDRAQTITGAVNFLTATDKEELKQLFIKEAFILRQALTLCRSILEVEERIEAAFFEAVRTMLTRVVGSGKISLKEINESINNLLKQSIKSEGVINLFSDVGEKFSLFDSSFLADIAKMKEKNLAVEILKKLIAEQVSVYKRSNLVQSEKFSEMLSRTMSNYLKGMLTNEQVIEELLKMAREIALDESRGEELGLTQNERAFYDALTKPEAIMDFYSNEQLINITKELTDELRANRTIDWQHKESARAGMRRLVKRLLSKYNYPPEGLEYAIDTVLSQCEMWSENS